MKQLRFCSILLTLVFSVPIAAVAPFIQPRSQSEDSSRELAGWTRYINLYDTNCFYGSWTCTLEYSRTMGTNDIRHNLFGTDIINDVNPFIKISGSRVADRDAADWLADYFGLPTDFQSKITFDPIVDNTICDLNLYLGLDHIQNGLYFRIHAPIVHTRWNINFNETDIVSGVNGYDPGYFAPTAIARAQLLENFTEFATGVAAPSLGAQTTFNRLSNAKISKTRKAKTGVSEIQAAFGWNFLQGPDHHFGLNIRGAAPTGTRPTGEFLFEPMIGNGHHWELGLGVTTHVILFCDECKPRMVSFYCDANLTHLFSTHQKRTFDLISKPLSRYMLVETLGTPVTNLFISSVQGTAAGSIAPLAQFQNLYAPLANLSTFDVNVSIAAQVDLTAMIDICWGNWNFDFGYNFWARTCEKIKPRCLCTIPFNSTTRFALKGDARTYGFVAADALSSPLPPGTAIPLSATQSRADIHSGTNTPIGTPFNPSQNQNLAIDGGQNQWAFVNTSDDTNQIVVFPGENADLSGINLLETQQRSTLSPVFIQVSTIDIEAAETKGLSNRLFAHASYNWDVCDCNYVPFTGMGGFIEFAHHSSGKCMEPDFDGSCQTVAFSQWGVWLKAGVGF